MSCLRPAILALLVLAVALGVGMLVALEVGVYYRQRGEIMERRKEVSKRTLQRHRHHSRPSHGRQEPPPVP